MASLEISDHRGGIAAHRLDGWLQLNAEREWLVTGDAEALKDVAGALPSRLWDFFGTQCLCLRFGNCIGRFEVPHLGRVHVTTGKWTEAHFELMLSRLTEVSASLPFAGHESAAIPYDRSITARNDVLYHAFVYLRHILSPASPRHVRLLPALEAIVRQPHRLFVREQQRVVVWRARRVGVAGLQAIAEGREPLTRAGRGSAVLAGMRGMMPATVVEHFARHEVDTPENRFVKSFLAQAMGILDAVEAAFRDDLSLGPSVLADCGRMKAQLGPYARHSLWEDVGEMAQVPTASTVLQQRRGYRDVFHHSRKLRLGSRVPLDSPTIRDLLEVKNIADLYELWCYFEVVAALRELHGRPSAVEGVTHDAKQASLAWGHRVTWRSGVEAFYNLTFSRARKGPRQSYALALRPDIALWMPHDGEGRWFVLDAKFKLKRLPNDDDDTLVFKRSDLDKMHVYRDALPAVKSAHVLYPGDRDVFYEAPDGGGVGALPALPGGANDSLRRLLAGISGAASEGTPNVQPVQGHTPPAL